MYYYPFFFQKYLIWPIQHVIRAIRDTMTVSGVHTMPRSIHSFYSENSFTAKTKNTFYLKDASRWWQGSRQSTQYDTIQYMGPKTPKTFDLRFYKKIEIDGNEIDDKMPLMRKWENVAKGIRKCWRNEKMSLKEWENEKKE